VSASAGTHEKAQERRCCPCTTSRLRGEHPGEGQGHERIGLRTGVTPRSSGTDLASAQTPEVQSWAYPTRLVERFGVPPAVVPLRMSASVLRRSRTVWLPPSRTSVRLRGAHHARAVQLAHLRVSSRAAPSEGAVCFVSATASVVVLRAAARHCRVAPPRWFDVRCVVYVLSFECVRVRCASASALVDSVRARECRCFGACLLSLLARRSVRVGRPGGLRDSGAQDASTDKGMRGRPRREAWSAAARAKPLKVISPWAEPA
jgi:hypothetical protein